MKPDRRQRPRRAEATDARTGVAPAAGSGFAKWIGAAAIALLAVPAAGAAIPAKRIGPPAQATPIPPGRFVQWNFTDAPHGRLFRSGPLRIRIFGRRAEEHMATPVVEIEGAGLRPHRMVGETAYATFDQAIATFRLSRSARVPAVLFQSFTGGAHCCNHVQVAVPSGAGFATVDLGEWDGDEIHYPKDLSGDGIPDFLFVDNSFLYGFASYADSWAPPKILDIVDGRVVDVSRRPAFRTLYAHDMAKAEKACRPGANGPGSNGACAAFVADAARLGRAAEAWRIMLASYDRAADWTLPDCAPKRACTYPQALLAFLKAHGYLPAAWMPPRASSPARRAAQRR